MTVAAIMLFLAGALAGSLLVMGAVVLGHKRRARPHEKDPIYAAARYAAVTHCRRYGNITHAALRDALDVPDMTVERYLGMLENEGIISKHGRGARTFYTRV